jgi:hypothetical protein
MGVTLDDIQLIYLKFLLKSLGETTTYLRTDKRGKDAFACIEGIGDKEL